MMIFSCSKDDVNDDNNNAPVWVYNGDSYFELNGERFELEGRIDGEVITPFTLNADTENDAYNKLIINIDSEYTITFDGVEYASQDDYYEYRLTRLSEGNTIKVVLHNNVTGYENFLYIETFPSSLEFGEVTYDSSLQDGYYYFTLYGYKYALKINTKGELVYYRKSIYVPTLFNRTVIDEGKSTETIYYSYLETIVNEAYPYQNGVGYETTKAVVMDKNYQVIDEVNYIIKDEYPNHPLENHQFEILGHNHYLTSAYVFVENYDVAPMNAENVNLVAASVQEIKDGELVFDWWSLDHDELYEYCDDRTYDSNGGWIDYCHFNSAAIDPRDGNMLMSFRQLSSLVKVKRGHDIDGDGSIMWILSGDRKGGNFESQTDNDSYLFCRQHDIKFINDQGTFIFYNNNSNIELHPSYTEYSNYNTSSTTAAVMRFTIDDVTDSTAPQITDFERFDGLYRSGMRGSAQEMYNTVGHYVMCWGDGNTAGSMFTEIDYNNGNKKLFEMLTLPNSSDYSSYRVYKYDL